MLPVLVSLTACNRYGEAEDCNPKRPQQATWQDPVYPGASQIQLTPTPLGAMTTFETNASPGTVLAFYAKALSDADWRLMAPGGHRPTPNGLDFEAANCCVWGDLSVAALATRGGLTRVTIDHNWDQGCM